MYICLESSMRQFFLLYGRMNQTRKNKQTLASRFFRPGNNSNSSSNNQIRNKNIYNNNANILNRLEIIPEHTNKNNSRFEEKTPRTITFKKIRRVRNIPQEGKSIPVSNSMNTKTRKYIGALTNSPNPLTQRFTSELASRLLADAHAKSNTYAQMSAYIESANLSTYYPNKFPKSLINKQIPVIKKKAFQKLNRSYTNLINEPEGATAPTLPNNHSMKSLV